MVGGVERDNMKNVFYRVLPENWTIDDLLTALIDHIAYGSVLHNTNPALSDVMGADASRYLDKVTIQHSFMGKTLPRLARSCLGCRKSNHRSGYGEAQIVIFLLELHN